jgi:hypothetical protein
MLNAWNVKLCLLLKVRERRWGTDRRVSRAVGARIRGQSIFILCSKFCAFSFRSTKYKTSTFPLLSLHQHFGRFLDLLRLQRDTSHLPIGNDQRQHVIYPRIRRECRSSKVQTPSIRSSFYHDGWPRCPGRHPCPRRTSETGNRIRIP